MNSKTVEGALSLIVCREGTIVAEEYTNYKTYGTDSIKSIMSVTKTFTGVLVGLAIDKGYIESVNDPISKYLTGIVTFPDNTKQISQSTSFSKCRSDIHGTALHLQAYIIHGPLLPITCNTSLIFSCRCTGTVFNYSDGASHLLSVIITEATGINTFDFAKTYLF